IAGDHPLHNTLGNCAAGPQTAETLGAPDALLLGAPPDPEPEDEGIPLTYDYGSDSFLEPASGTDKAHLMLPEARSDCHYEAAMTDHPEAKEHRWVSDPMPTEFKLNRIVTLELYSETENELSSPGRICAFLFIRHDISATEWSDSRINNPETG